MLQLSLEKEISGVVGMCLDEALMLLCAHAAQRNVQEIAQPGIEHECVHVYHLLGFHSVSCRASGPAKMGGKGCKLSVVAKVFWST